jgi:DUF917 family protein
LEKTTLQTLQDCEDLLEGALWMGTGGGGSYDDGMRLLKGALESGLSIEWVDVETIPDEVWTATIGLHGSIAPMSKETQDKINKMGLVDNMGDTFIPKAVEELGGYLGLEFGCLVPAELGAEAIPEALVCAAHLGIPVVDGDYVGRAVPEEMQSTYCLYGKQSNLFASVDKWGNVVIVKDAVNTHALERIAKMLASAAFGYTAVATTPLKAQELKEILVRGTITRCLKIGRALRRARNSGVDPINTVLDNIDGWKLFEGTIIGVEMDDRDGYFFGTTHIKGAGDFQGQALDVWFKNENLVSWLNDSPWICSPDLLTLVYKASGSAIYNADVKEGEEVVVIGMRGLDGFRTERGLNLAGPRHFGFDIEYTPIEKLINPS